SGAAVVVEHLRARLSHGVQIAESRNGGGARRLRVHPAGHVLTDALLDVKRELVVDFGRRGRREDAERASAGRFVAHGRPRQTGGRAESNAGPPVTNGAPYACLMEDDITPLDAQGVAAEATRAP